jgi:hypothetical protein
MASRWKTSACATSTLTAGANRSRDGKSCRCCAKTGSLMVAMSLAASRLLAQCSGRTAMSDFRDLCARMADELDHYRQLLMDDRRETHALATEARAALAQPEPEGPSDKELDLVVIAIQALIPPQPDATTHHLSAVDRGREILRQRLARWGNL